jgi:hypothetical protein
MRDAGGRLELFRWENFRVRAGGALHEPVLWIIQCCASVWSGGCSQQYGTLGTHPSLSSTPPATPWWANCGVSSGYPCCWHLELHVVTTADLHRQSSDAVCDPIVARCRHTSRDIAERGKPARVPRRALDLPLLLAVEEMVHGQRIADWSLHACRPSKTEHDGVWWGCHPKLGGNPPMHLASRQPREG